MTETIRPRELSSGAPPSTAVEERELIVRDEGAYRHDPAARCVHELFEQRARHDPDVVAVVSGQTGMTYGELDFRADRLADYLVSRGVGPEVLVGICVERGVEMVVAVLGVLKAGGAYLPLDPDYPADRLAFMLADSAVSLVLTQRSLADRLPAAGTDTVCLDDDGRQRDPGSGPVARAAVGAENLAYVIYTSGSTGRPKGVMVSHGCLVNVFLSHRARILEPAGRAVTPSLLRSVVRAGLLAGAGYQPLVITVGGEAVDAELCRALAAAAPATASYNAYGPTECTLDALVWRIRHSDRPLLGRPVDNLCAYVLDAELRPAPAGVPGELYLAPRTAAEQLLAEIWGEVLGVERVGVHDDFVDLGGDSLLAMKVAARLRQVWGVALPVRAFFDTPTIATLVGRVSDQGRSVVAADAIGPTAGGTTFPLSSAQQRLWFLEEFQPGGVEYNTAAGFRLRGMLDRSALTVALNALVARHESLRTTFDTVDGRGVQVVNAPFEVPVEAADLSSLPPPQRHKEVDQRLTGEIGRPFDLRCGPLFRAVLLTLAADEHLLVLNLHHIVTDGWSMGLLTGELGALYSAALRNESIHLTPLPVRYADFACWQRERLAGSALDDQIAYWQRKLAGVAALELPTDRPRPAVRTSSGAVHRCRIPVDVTARLSELGRARGATLFMTLAAATQVLLGRYSGQRDIALGTVTYGRNRTELEQLIGFFVNTVVIRSTIERSLPFEDFLGQVRGTVLEAFGNDEIPFDRLVEVLRPERDASRSPLVQAMMVLQTPAQPMELAGLQVEDIDLPGLSSRFDLTVEFQSRDGSLATTIEYNTDLFDTGTVERMADHLLRLLEGIADDPRCPLSRLPLLGAAERRQVVEWNDTTTDFPADRCVHEMFAERAREHPGATALTFEGTSLTYGELDARANQLAHHLIGHGVGPDVTVGICLWRCPELIIGLLAILKAGGAYVPLDPDYPVDRLEFMLADSGTRMVLTQRSLRDRLPLGDAGVLCLDHDWPVVAAHPSHPPPAAVGPDNLIYVSYTSGSSGRPKGVLVVHRSVVRLCHAADIRIGADDVLAQFASVSFDASTFEIWGALLAGARLAICPPGLLFVEELKEFLGSEGVTTLWLTAGLFHEIVDADVDVLAGLRRLIAGGDVLSPPRCAEVVRRLPHLELVNGYGPTEGTTFTSCHRLGAPASPGNAVPIGRPIAGTRCYVLDRDMNVVPVGVRGELYIGGAGLARGYLNRPELTAERFVADPFGVGQRLYRTGDVVRWRAGGVLEFAGRVDDQVKVRGFRVEPGEVEAALRRHPDLADAIVVARQDGSGHKRLVGYVVPRGTQAPTTPELRAFAARILPDYLVPATFVPLDRLPLSPHGKVDRAALPAPARDGTGRRYVPAPTPAEELAYWRQRLAGVEPLELPTDRPRPAVRTSTGAHQKLMVPAEVTARLKELGRRQVATLFMVLVAATKALFARYCGKDDIAVGTVVAGRPREEREHRANTVVLRSTVDEEESFADLLARVRQSVLEAFAHAEVPFERVVEVLQPERDPSRTPLVQAMVVLQDIPTGSECPGLTVDEVGTINPAVPFDLVLEFQERSGVLVADLDYNADLFEASTMARLTRHLGTLLAGVAADPGQALRRLSLLGDTERRQLVAGWNDTAMDYPTDLTVAELFRRRVQHHPHRPAVRAAGTAVSYRELDDRARVIAVRLAAHGVRRGDRVCTVFDPGVEAVASFVALASIGAAYISVESDVPPERLRSILSNGRPVVVLTSRQARTAVPDAAVPRGTRVICTEELTGGAGELWARASGTGPGSADPLCCIYTSGSTGNPKGVVLTQRNLMNLVRSHGRAWGASTGGRCGQVASLSFDASVWEIWSTLCHGGCLCVAEPRIRPDARALGRWVVAEELVLCFFPTVIGERVIASGALAGADRLRYVVLGGDTLTRLPEHPTRFALVNGYGPTEATVFATWFDTTGWRETDRGFAAPPVGRPLSNVQAHVLDKHLRLVPVGCVGELYLAGDGLAQGYLGEAALTAERFVANPFGTQPGVRMYRTGDRVRRTADGLIEFRGRTDRQVKVHGVRVELDEIEQVLTRQENVAEAAVITRAGPGQAPTILAYVTSVAGSPVDVEELRRGLRRHLPEAMLPTRIHWLAAMPRTPTGKTDRRLLAERAEPAVDSAAIHTPARTGAERAVEQLWAAVLGRDAFDVHEKFFDAGGSSLALMDLRYRLEPLCRREISIALLFEHSTIEAMARLVDQRRAAVAGDHSYNL